MQEGGTVGYFKGSGGGVTGFCHKIPFKMNIEYSSVFHDENGQY